MLVQAVSIDSQMQPIDMAAHPDQMQAYLARVSGFSFVDGWPNLTATYIAIWRSMWPSSVLITVPALVNVLHR